MEADGLSWRICPSATRRQMKRSEVYPRLVFKTWRLNCYSCSPLFSKHSETLGAKIRFYCFLFPFYTHFVSYSIISTINDAVSVEFLTFLGEYVLSLVEKSNYPFWQSANTLGFLSLIISFLSVRLLRTILLCPFCFEHTALLIFYSLFKTSM